MYEFVITFADGSSIRDPSYCAFSIGMGGVLRSELRERFPNAESVFVRDLETGETYGDETVSNIVRRI